MLTENSHFVSQALLGIGFITYSVCHFKLTTYAPSDNSYQPVHPRSDQGFHYPLEETSEPWLSKEAPDKVDVHIYYMHNQEIP